MSENLKVSTETLPPADDRAAAVKSIDEKCRAIVNLAHRVHDAESESWRAQTELESAMFEAGGRPCEKVSAALSAARSACIVFGQLEADLYALKDEIEADLKRYNRDKRWCIYVAHTAEGLPIRVSKERKTPLWGY